jgi:dTDP-4-dehydrorhamnose reductase
MLGQALVRQFRDSGFDVVSMDKQNADFTFDITDDDALEKMVKQVFPDVLINAVAIVNINFCQKNPGLAYLVNARPAGVLSNILRGSKTYFIQISTDHFYTGDASKKHTEKDVVSLDGEYARTKYIAERFALCYENALVVRTNIVGFRGESDRLTFVEWVIDSMMQRKQMFAFYDYYVSSIDVKNFSKILYDLILGVRPAGLYNLSSRDVFSKKDFIFSLSQALGFSTQNISVESLRSFSDDFKKRNESLGLDVDKVEKILGYSLPNLATVIESLADEYKRIYR